MENTDEKSLSVISTVCKMNVLKIFQMTSRQKATAISPPLLLPKRAVVSFSDGQHENQVSEESHSTGVAAPPVWLPPQSSVRIFRSDEFRGGSSGTAMSCRLGMLTTMRL